MVIRFEHQPYVGAMGALAYQTGVQEAARKREQEERERQMQLLRMQQQQQQQNLDRSFNAWKTRYGAASALQRMKADYQYRGNEQDKNFTNSVELNRVQQEANQRAARDAQIAAMDKQAKQAELMKDNAAAVSARSLQNHYMDEQLLSLNPTGDGEAMKLWSSHLTRAGKGTLSAEQIEQDLQQTYQQISTLQDNPLFRSRKGQAGYSKAFQGDDGIWQRTFTDKNGDTQTSPAPHPTKGWIGTLNQVRLQLREDENDPYFDRATGRRVRDVRTAALTKSTDGSGYYIKIDVQTGVPAPDERTVALDKQREYDTQLNTTAPEITSVNPKFKQDELSKWGPAGYKVPPTIKSRQVVSKNRRQMLVDKYGPMRNYEEEVGPGDPGFEPGWVHPRIQPTDKPAWEAELVRRNKLEINEAIGRDQPRGAQAGPGDVDEVDQMDVADEARDVLPPELDPNAPPAPPGPAAAAPGAAAVFTAQDDERLATLEAGLQQGQGARDPAMQGEVTQLREKKRTDLDASIDLLDNPADRAWMMELARDPRAWQEKYPMQGMGGQPTEHSQRRDRVWNSLQRIMNNRRMQATEERRVDDAELGRFHEWIDETRRNLQGAGKLTPELQRRLEQSKNIQGKSPQEIDQLRKNLEAESRAALEAGAMVRSFRGIFA